MILTVPLTGAVVTAMVLALLLPDDLRLGPRWALPTLEGILLLALVAGDPDWFSRRSDGLAHRVDRPGERARAQCHLVDRAPRRGPEEDENVRLGQEKRMADLSELLQQGMRRRHLNAQALAERTGIRTPRIRVFAQDGARGPVQPTQAELAELATALALHLPEVLDAARTPQAAPSA
ncbi:hypothetical protein AB0J81_30725 [Streptomyces bobili]